MDRTGLRLDASWDSRVAGRYEEAPTDPSSIVGDYDVAFVGGGLAALLLLRELRRTLPGRVAVIDPCPPVARPLVHWSYWNAAPTFLDHFAIGSWAAARVADRAAESLAPLTLRLVRSTDVLTHLDLLLRPLPIVWHHTRAHTITRLPDGRYAVTTDGGVIRAGWVFDSACALAPAFPAQRRPHAVVSGTGLHVRADRPVFDAATATLFDPLDEGGFVYLLPLSPTEALLDSALFAPQAREPDQAPLLRYLRRRYPAADFTVAHAESGWIPLGFAPRRTTGPRHILLGTKRGLVKPSSGFGVLRMVKESRRLVDSWRQQRPLPPSGRAALPWTLFDDGFLRLAAQHPPLARALLHRTMRVVPLVQALRFVDEDLPPRQLLALLRALGPAALRLS